jgi:hypothetical protein
MTDFTYDTALLPRPTSTNVELVSNTAFLRSNLTSAVQTVARPGEHWEYTCNWRNITGGVRADILAFFARLNGGEHRALMPFFGQVQRGALGGSPVADGAGQTGSTVNIRGADLSVTDWIKAGDVLVWGRTIHIATTDASTDGAGDVAVPIAPQIRRSPTDGETVFVSTTVLGKWILSSPVNFSNSSLTRLGDGSARSNLSLSFVDDVSAE